MQRSGGPRIVADGLCPEIVMQADIGGVTIAFTELVSGKSPDEISARVDVYRKEISRQRAHFALVEALVDLQARKNALEEMPEKERAYQKERVDERTRLRAAFEAAHTAAGKRAEFQLQPKHRQALETFDAETAANRKKRFEDEKAKIEADIPIYEAQVARQRAIIAGRERSEVIEAAKAAAD